MFPSTEFGHEIESSHSVKELTLCRQSDLNQVHAQMQLQGLCLYPTNLDGGWMRLLVWVGRGSLRGILLSTSATPRDPDGHRAGGHTSNT